ncbi:hypothetical protein [Granulicella sp. S190]|nr:hypothetical protein [Granulicella sp. S190]
MSDVSYFTLRANAHISDVEIWAFGGGASWSRPSATAALPPEDELS